MGGDTKTSQSKHFAEVKRMVHDFPRQQELLLRNNNIQQPSHSQGRPDIIQPVDTPRRGLFPPYMGGGYVWPPYETTPYPRLPALRRPATTYAWRPDDG